MPLSRTGYPRGASSSPKRRTSVVLVSSGNVPGARPHAVPDIATPASARAPRRSTRAGSRSVRRVVPRGDVMGSSGQRRTPVAPRRYPTHDADRNSGAIVVPETRGV